MKNESLKRISGYGVAVAAVLGTSAKADIIYANLDVTGSTTPTNDATILSFNMAGNVATDSSHVANEQFYASHVYKNSSHFAYSKLNFHAVSGAHFDPSPLAYGTLITGSMTTNTGGIFPPTGALIDNGGPEPAQWSAGQQAYIGLQFDNGGTTNYGWAEITTVNAYTITLDGFAYDDVANEPVAAGSLTPVPEPSQMALFALGAAGIAAFRRRKKNSVAAAK